MMNTKQVRSIGVVVVGILVVAGITFAYSTLSKPSSQVPVTPLAVEEVAENEAVVPVVRTEIEHRDEQKLAASVSGLTASITGPSSLMDRIKRCVYTLGWYGAGGNGLSVDWGDGTKEPELRQDELGKSCVSVVRDHTYKIPGTYSIHVVIWHPGPADAPVTDWEDRLTVTVK